MAEFIDGGIRPCINNVTMRQVLPLKSIFYVKDPEKFKRRIIVVLTLVRGNQLTVIEAARALVPMDFALSKAGCDELVDRLTALTKVKRLTAKMVDRMYDEVMKK